jgi:putative membrane protein
MAFGDERSRKALHDAGEAIERAAAVEIVVAIRPRARHVVLPPLVVGVCAAAMMLALTLFADADLAPWQAFVLPLGAGIVAGGLVVALAPLERLLVPPFIRRAHVREAARALFVDRRVHATTKRSGVLVFLAVREQVVELVADLAVVDAIGQPALDAWSRELGVLFRGDQESALAKLAERFAAKLPHHAGDTNELADDVVDVKA